MQEHDRADQKQSHLIHTHTGLKNTIVFERKRSVEQYAASFNLTTLNGINGFVIEGLIAYDYLGEVSTAGDFNGDGKADMVVGAYYASPGGRTQAGTAYVIFGQAGGWLANFNFATLNGSNGFVIEGLTANDFLGYSVSTAGDLNGDGKADLVVGAFGVNPGGRSSAGSAYVIFGQASGWSANFNLATLNGSNGFVIEGLAAGNYLGWSVSTAGDLNGDGKADLVVGAPYADPGGRGNAGSAYVIFGQASGWPANFNLATLNGANGFVIEGVAADDRLGKSVSTAGDLNGDGKADLVIGVSEADPSGRIQAGTAYVIFGQASGWPANFNLATLNGANGFVIEGVAADDRLGKSVSTIGDLNGDGKADLVVGAAGVSLGGRNDTGTAYVIFGQVGGWPANFNPAMLNGTNGFVIEGLAANDFLGSSVSTAGDLNGDGKSELVVGADQADPGGRSSAGSAYVIFGQVSGWPANFNLTMLNGGNGFVIEGLAANNGLGSSVSTAGDLNGDGKADLVVGAPLADPGGRDNAGSTYVIFGLNATANRPPEVIHSIADQPAEFNQPFSFQVASDTFSDPDGDVLTYTAVQSGSNALPSWLQFNGVTCFFSGTPNQTGITPINVTASDPYGLKASTAFNIKAQNALSLSSNDTGFSINGGLIGGVIGGLAAVGGLAGAAYLAYKRGFFASLSRRNEGNSPTNTYPDIEIELTRKTGVSPLG